MTYFFKDEGHGQLW